MKAPIYIAFLLLAALTACTQTEEQPARIVRCADMPEARTSATAWSIGGRGYVLGGRGDGNRIDSTLYIYEAATDRWSDKQATPLSPRVNACACAVGEKAYIGLGFCGKAYGDDAYLNDWWEYTPATNSWRRLSDYPNENTVGAIAYTDGEHIYCVHGFGWGFTTDVVCYDIATDRWTAIERDKHPEHASMAGAGGTVGRRHYFGTGYNTRSLNEWYEIDFQGKWTERKSVPSRRENSVCVATERFIYLAGGQYFGGTLTDGKVFDDVLRYSPEDDRWTMAGHTAEAAINRIGFSINGAAYIGLGEDGEENPLNCLYRIEE